MISKYLHKSNLRSNMDNLNSFENIISSISDTWGLQTQKNTTDFYTVDDYFSDEEIFNIIHLSKKLPKTNGSISNDNIVNSEIRISDVSWVPVNNISDWIYKKITGLIHQVNEDFYEYDLVLTEKFQFTVYKSNSSSMYKKHLDCGSNFVPGMERKLSMVLQLSDPEEYTGGDLVLHMRQTPTIIEKKKGRIVFFPSHVLHEVTPVTSGTRMSLVGWISGPRLK